jgi:hypothetical protein
MLVPPPTGPLAPQFFGNPRTQWTSKKLLVARSVDNGILSAIEWPSGQIQQTELRADSLAALFAGVLTTETQDGGRLVWIDGRRVMEPSAVKSGPDGKIALSPTGPIIHVGSTELPPIYLHGGNYLVFGGFSVSDLVVHKVVGGERRIISSANGSSSRVLVTPKADTWVRVVSASQSVIESIELMEGFNRVRSINLPPVPNSLKEKLIANMTTHFNAWVAANKPPTVRPLPSNFLANEDVAELLANQDRLLLTWRLAAPFSSEALDILILEPVAIYRTGDGRNLRVEVAQLSPTNAVLAFDVTAQDSTVTITENFSGLLYLNSLTALAGDFSPTSRQFHLRQAPNGNRIPLTTRLNGSPTGPQLSGARLARDQSRFAILGTAPKNDGSVEYWIELFALPGGQPTSCDVCKQLGAKEFQAVLRRIDTKAALDMPPLGALPVVPFWHRSLLFSANMRRMMYLSEDFLLVSDLQSQRNLLTTKASLPMLLLDSAAITKIAPHQMKLYEFGAN